MPQTVTVKAIVQQAHIVKLALLLSKYFKRIQLLVIEHRHTRVAFYLFSASGRSCKK